MKTRETLFLIHSPDEAFARGFFFPPAKVLFEEDFRYTAMYEERVIQECLDFRASLSKKPPKRNFLAE